MRECGINWFTSALYIWLRGSFVSLDREERGFHSSCCSLVLYQEATTNLVMVRTTKREINNSKLSNLQSYTKILNKQDSPNSLKRNKSLQ